MLSRIPSAWIYCSCFFFPLQSQKQVLEQILGWRNFSTSSVATLVSSLMLWSWLPQFEHLRCMEVGQRWVWE